MGYTSNLIRGTLVWLGVSGKSGRVGVGGYSNLIGDNT